MKVIQPTTTAVALTASANDISNSKRVYLCNTHSAEVTVTVENEGAFVLESGESIFVNKTPTNGLTASVINVVQATGCAIRD